MSSRSPPAFSFAPPLDSAPSVSDHPALRVDAPPRPRYLLAALNARHAANAASLCAPSKSRLAELEHISTADTSLTLPPCTNSTTAPELAALVRYLTSKVKERRGELRHLGARAPPNGYHPRVRRTPHPVRYDDDGSHVAALVCLPPIPSVSSPQILTSSIPLHRIPHGVLSLSTQTSSASSQRRLFTPLLLADPDAIQHYL
ncbi:hypothetical protein C8R46DRAFT_1208235 [Mycena filopes]|nr:hypothetical protein C8R46DRAFT_1230712 [Mycena filopes]KAJ7186155.1 hypothetical protein C8R46DRAFT_1208235 [Mycena filopes]